MSASTLSPWATLWEHERWVVFLLSASLQWPWSLLHQSCLDTYEVTSVKLVSVCPGVLNVHPWHVLPVNPEHHGA